MMQTIWKRGATALVPLCLWALAGCSSGLIDNGSGGLEAGGYGTSSGTSSKRVYEVASDQSSLTISGLSGTNDVYVVRLNTSTIPVFASQSRYVTSSSIEDSSASANVVGAASLLASADGAKFKHYVPPEGDDSVTRVLNRRASARSAAPSVPMPKATRISSSLGTSTTMYIHTAHSSTYTEKTVRLRYAGTYCYVWVVDGYWTDAASGSSGTVGSDDVQKIGSYFDALYPFVREVFGEESDDLYGSDSDIYDMDTYSKTGTMVNIVMFDLDGDRDPSGVLGYFSRIEYYIDQNNKSPYCYSNKGKYLYLDSYAVTENFGTQISTLVHEFQHMIHFNQKNILQGAETSTWFNEMQSVLCEDMMADKIEELAGDDYNAVYDSAWLYLPELNRYYYSLGLTQWDGSNISYSIAYGFGAWVARQYGGAALVRKMATNAYTDTAAIMAAVNSQNGTSYTFADLYAQYVQALVFNDTSNRTHYTLNIDAAQKFSSGSYSYSMNAVDLWRSEWGGTASGSTYYGPITFNPTQQHAIPSYGAMVLYAGRTSDSSVELEFSTSTHAGQRLFVMVKPAEGDTPTALTISN